MMALRFLLGIAEAGFGPGVPFYLTYFYYRRELNTRIGYFMAVAPLASAFAGALAYGITYHKHSIESWRILFIVEGVPSVLVGLVGYYAIPNSPQECRFLTEHERKIALARTVRQTGATEKSTKIEWGETFKSLLDLKTLLPCAMFFSFNVSFSSLPVFLPTILQGMGYTSINAQGLSAPPYVAAFFCTLFFSWLSDRIAQRGLLLAGGAFIGAIGYLILAVAHNVGARYFAVYLAACGLFPCIPLLLTWVGNNHGSDTKRGIGYSLLQAVGQCGPLLGTRLFPSKDAPLYRTGFWVSFAFLMLAAALAIIFRLYLAWLNKKLDDKYGYIDRAEAMNATDEAAGPTTFRYVL
jgi:MFS family permease